MDKIDIIDKIHMPMDKIVHDNATMPISKSWQREEVLRRRSISSGTKEPFYFNRGVRTDASLVPPIRQTASIFKQPVTVIRNQESIVKHDLKYGPQEKPRQLFWEKRLESFRACDIDGDELKAMNLPFGLLPVGPNISQETLLQSVATALHVFNHPVTGQTAPRTSLDKNSGVFLNPDQPLIEAITVCDDDIKKQEEKVNEARRKLQEAIKVIE